MFNMPENPISSRISVNGKANNLKPYEYMKYLLEEIPRHMNGSSLAFLDDLLPWSDKLPGECRRITTGK